MTTDHFEITDTWAATAAADLVRMIDARLPAAWERHHDDEGMWRWHLDGEPSQVVAVNGREDRILVPMHGWSAKVGPTVMAGDIDGAFASVTLPHVSDRHEHREALRLLERIVPNLGDPDPTA